MLTPNLALKYVFVFRIDLIDEPMAGITDLHFHDLRHEAISRFFEMGLSVPEVALISGHRDYRMLFRYPTIEDGHQRAFSAVVGACLRRCGRSLGESARKLTMGMHFHMSSFSDTTPTRVDLYVL